MKQRISSVCSIALVAAAGCASNPAPAKESPSPPQISAAIPGPMPRAHCGDAPPHTVVLLSPDALTARGEVLAKWCEKTGGHLYHVKDPALAGHLESPKELQAPSGADYYPLEARRRGYQGTVLLMIRVDPDGSVGEAAVLVSSGYKVLDDAASSFFTHVRYKIGPRLDGQPVSVVGYAPFDFYLNKWSKAHWGGPPPPLDQKVATQLALAAAGCKHPDDCDVRGHLDDNNWAFVVSFAPGRDADGKPLFTPGGGWVGFTIDPEGRIRDRKAAD